MQHGHGEIGSRKHGKSGNVHNIYHFTGKKRGKRIRRKKKKQVQKRMHKNKYSSQERDTAI